MNYLQLVNKVLIRLRENEVTSVQDNPYSKLIGEFINVVKREVEDTWNWQAMATTITAYTVDGVYSYILTGSGTRSRIIDVVDDTNNTPLDYRDSKWFNQAFLTSDLSQKNSPNYYNINGVSLSGDAQVDLFPIPDQEYAIRFNLYQPEPDLEADADILILPYQVVIEGALARAISERGDDGGYTEQEQRYNRVLSDYIAIEAGYRPDETIWQSV